MPNRVPWNPAYGLGHEILDSQHRNILAQCNAMADCLSQADPQSELKFRSAFDALMAQAADHFATEEKLLTECGHALLEEHQDECDEFDYLAKDILTAENFERVEQQRFLALWWVGHIVGFGKKYRALLDKLPPGT